MLTPSVAVQPEKEPPYHVPGPAGWAKETIALPPAFAPDMKWKGTEELRFAPGMFKAGAADFFSYALLFWLPDDAEIDARAMERELLAYYRGLAPAVLKGRCGWVKRQLLHLTNPMGEPLLTDEVTLSMLPTRARPTDGYQATHSIHGPLTRNPPG